jgi:adenosylhomocysteine nucleosidase
MPQCDLLLFVATPTEREELEAAAKERGGTFEKIPPEPEEKARPRESYWLGTVGTTRVIAVKTKMGTVGDRASAALGFHYREKTKAQSIICLGMAFGISEKFQSFGDVLVSESVFPYDDRDIVAEGDFWRYDYPSRARTFPANPTTLRMLEAHRGNVKGYRVFPGCILTGNAVVRSTRFRDSLVQWSSTIACGVVGGEMEGTGLLALDAPHEPKWTIVKGICDFAGEQQKEDAKKNRALASKNAVAFVLDALLAFKPGES